MTEPSNFFWLSCHIDLSSLIFFHSFKILSSKSHWDNLWKRVQFESGPIVMVLLHPTSQEHFHFLPVCADRQIGGKQLQVCSHSSDGLCRQFGRLGVPWFMPEMAENLGFFHLEKVDGVWNLQVILAYCETLTVYQTIALQAKSTCKNFSLWCRYCI